MDLLPFQDNKVTGRKADVIQAAYLASELAQRLVVPGNEVMRFSQGGCLVEHLGSREEKLHDLKPKLLQISFISADRLDIMSES